jgi:hypothetical protein
MRDDLVCEARGLVSTFCIPEKMTEFEKRTVY